MAPKDTFWKKLTPLVFPIAFQQLMSALVSTSDTLMMGLIDQSSLSAVSLATQISFVVSLFVFGLTGAGSLLAAQYWGKGSRDDVEPVFAVMLRPMTFVGAVFTLAAFFVPKLLMRIFTPDPVLIDLGSGYLRAVALSLKRRGRVVPKSPLISLLGAKSNNALPANFSITVALTRLKSSIMPSILLSCTRMIAAVTSLVRICVPIKMGSVSSPE